MATTTPNFNFILPGVADPADQNTWGNELNDNLTSQDALLGGFAPKASPTFTGTITLNGLVNEKISADVASAATINLDAATGNIVNITGTTAITAVTLAQGARRKVRFGGVLTLTNSTNLVLPTGANIVTQAGDYAEFVGNNGVVQVSEYQRADGTPLSGTAPILAKGFAFGTGYAAPIILFGGVGANVGGWFNASTGRITASLPVGITGYLQINATIDPAGGNAPFTAQVYKNGAALLGALSLGIGYGQPLTWLGSCVNGDYFDIRFTGGNQTFLEPSCLTFQQLG